MADQTVIPQPAFEAAVEAGRDSHDRSHVPAHFDCCFSSLELSDAICAGVAAAAPVLTAERDAEITRLRTELATTKASLHDARWMARDVLASRAAEIEQLQAEVAAQRHDLVYRLAAADRQWCDGVGDTPATPQYMHHLAEHVTAPQDASCPGATPPVARSWRDSEGDLWRDGPGDRLVLIEHGGEVVYYPGSTDRDEVEAAYGPLTEVVPVSTPGGGS